MEWEASVDAWFRPDGYLRQAWPSFEYRKGQHAMARAVARALQETHILLVEAGTGIGKTFAYLIPTLLAQRPFTVATGTITLQEQLLYKDIPIVAEMGLVRGVALLKGRSHYVCLWKWHRLQRQPPLGLVEQALWDTLTQWIHTTTTGDRAELTQWPEDVPIWAELTADVHTCPGVRCAHFQDCFLYEARRRAERAPVIVVNHHLLLADARVRTRADAQILPDTPVLIIDEAHMLEEAAQSALTQTLYFFDFYRFLQQVQTSIDLTESIPNARIRQWNQFRARVHTAADALFGIPIPGMPERVAWESVRDRFPPMVEHLGTLQEVLTTLAGWVAELPIPVEERDQFAGWALELAGLCTLFLEPTDDQNVRYVEPLSSGREEASRRWMLCATPIRLGPILAEWLWPRFETVVLTSATLSYRNRFDHVLERLGLQDGSRTVVTETIPSPFNLAAQTRLWIPDDLPDPGHRVFLDALLPAVQALVELIQGKTLVLCTSYQNMQAIADHLTHHVPWPVYRQGMMPRRALMQVFREEVSSVLVATTSFWQGFDVAGEALQCVIVDKLPFDVPSDPVVQAQVEEIRRRGQDPFFAYQLPRAVMLLRQGLGRLIRRRDDVGIMALMDSRIWRRAYGRIILRELRPIPVTRRWEELVRWWQARSRAF